MGSSKEQKQTNLAKAGRTRVDTQFSQRIKPLLYYERRDAQTV